jgi:uncharacterized protein YcfL
MKLRPLLPPRALAAALLLALAGCASVNTVEPAFPQGKIDPIPDKRVITSSSLNDIAYVVGVDRGKTNDGLEIVQVKLQNLKSAVKNVNYRFQWFDAQGIALDPEPTKVVSIEGGAIVAIQDLATSAKAVDWQLTLSESVGYSPAQ